MYILAIACLIESRFPQHAVVHGDISRGQMAEAIKWANRVLQRPIQLTDRANNKKLFYRLNNILTEEYALLQAFMELTVNEFNEELGDFIREQFSKESIIDYLTKNLKAFSPKTIGFGELIQEYFNLGFDLETLCDICVLNEDGCKINPDEFIGVVMKSGFSFDDNENYDFLELATHNTNSTKPDTIETALGKVLLKIGGYYHRSAKQYMTLQEIRNVFEMKFGNNENLEKIMLTAIKDEKPENENFNDLMNALGLSKTISNIEQLHDNEDENCSEDDKCYKYDIMDFNALVSWKAGCTVSPLIDKSIRKVVDFVEKMIFEEKDFKNFIVKFNEMAKIERMNILIRANEYFYVNKQTWDYIEDQIENPDITNILLGLLNIKANEKSVNTLCKMLLWNKDLFEYYFGVKGNY